MAKKEERKRRKEEEKRQRERDGGYASGSSIASSSSSVGGRGGGLLRKLKRNAADLARYAGRNLKEAARQGASEAYSSLDCLPFFSCCFASRTKTGKSCDCCVCVETIFCSLFCTCGLPCRCGYPFWTLSELYREHALDVNSGCDCREIIPVWIVPCYGISEIKTALSQREPMGAAMRAPLGLRMHRLA